MTNRRPQEILRGGRQPIRYRRQARTRATGAAASWAVLPWLVLAAWPAFGAESRLERSRAIVGEFQQTLMGELKAAMAEGGPVQAIDVCRTVAPTIAARASEASGADVGRTALRLRNPANAPDPAAVVVLEQFRGEVQAGAVVAPERYAVRGDGSARYMRAIVLNPPCATCHGERLAPAVARALAEHYPQDRATGFSIGELRGAFIIDWPAAEAAGEPKR